MKKTLSEWLFYLQGIHVSAIDLGLERVIPVAEKLGIMNLAKDAYVFTVAGTNGKGSTTAVIAEICQQAGYTTGLYQSPELTDFNERVRINGQMATDASLITAFTQVDEARQACELSLSFFEITTLAALLLFAQADCDVWVLEVGLGGRLDVVNIIDPDVAVITNIGIDHVDWLGDNRESIGYEKAGILRQDIPLIYGETVYQDGTHKQTQTTNSQDPNTQASNTPLLQMPHSVQKRIDELGVRCYQLGRDYSFIESSSGLLTFTTDIPDVHSDAKSINEDSEKSIVNKEHEKINEGHKKIESTESAMTLADVWQFSTASITMQLPRPSLSLINTANAISAVLASKLTIQQSHIANAMQAVRLPGRFDYREVAGRRWLFDVAHNEHGVNFLLKQLIPRLPQLFPANTKSDNKATQKNQLQTSQPQNTRQQRSQGQIFILFSMLADKDVSTVIQTLLKANWTDIQPLSQTNSRQSVSLQPQSPQPQSPQSLQWFIAPLQHHRASSKAQLQAVAGQHIDEASVSYLDDMTTATDAVIQASTEDDLILVCGSFHTIKECLQELETV